MLATKIEKGIIREIAGDLGSGMRWVVFEDNSHCYLDGGFGMRQLYDAFDDHPRGHAIRYVVDECNIMTSFEPDCTFPDCQQCQKEDCPEEEK